jgi:cell wall-associated NlpC family hydrolase
MTLDGVAAAQTRIAQIQQLVSGTISATGTGASSSATASPTQSPEFASLLADAMASGTTSADPLSNSPSDGSSTSIGGSSMLNQLLAQMGSGTGGSATSSLASILGGTGIGTGQPDPATLAGLTATNPTSTATSTNSITQQFLSNALAEQGKPYVYGANANISDPNPKAFDCSELTKWASARAGVTIPDGATAQYLSIRDHGDTMTVQQALHTPGALLFHFGHEPRDLGDIPADGHVAISLGDGVHTIEARGHAYGTNVFDNAGGRSFNFAGMIPGMS